MKHLGDITKMNGAAIPVVDCITGGSPCQDLSIAGKREGLAGERSGLSGEPVRWHRWIPAVLGTVQRQGHGPVGIGDRGVSDGCDQASLRR